MAREIGAIAAGHEQTARAGAEILADGGNAIDAAVAAVFAACTCEPTLTGPGGGGFATIHLADGTDVVLDFFAAVPGIGKTIDTAMGPVPVDVMFGNTPQTFHVGPKSCAVPGFVAGVLGAHERFGRLPRERVLAPGIALARSGLDLTKQQAYCHHILEKILVRTAAGRELFAPHGPMLGAGDHFEQPELAETLEMLARDGAKAFYGGEIAEAIVRWSDENDGLISSEDLSRYEVRELAPVRSRYRELDIRSVPPPSSGGALIAFALRLLDVERAHRANANGRDGGVNVDTPEGARLLVETMIASNAMRGAHFDELLYGGGLLEWMSSGEALEIGRQHFINASKLKEVPHASSKLGSTTHLSVIDAEGNAIALTSSTGCGAGEFVSGTGIHLNNMLGEEDLLPAERTLHPGQRLTSMMAPSLILRDGKPLLATGSAGSNRIRSAIVQTLLRTLETRANDDRSLAERLHEATTMSRLHAEAGMVHAEPGYADDVLASLEAAGHKLERWPITNLYFGGVNMVAVASDGSFAAASDPRRGGGTAIANDDGTISN